MQVTSSDVIIGVSHSEPHLHVVKTMILLLVYIYMSIYISYVRPFGPGGPPVNALRANVRPAT